MNDGEDGLLLSFYLQSTYIDQDVALLASELEDMLHHNSLDLDKELGLVAMHKDSASRSSDASDFEMPSWGILIIVILATMFVVFAVILVCSQRRDMKKKKMARDAESETTEMPNYTTISYIEHAENRTIPLPNYSKSSDNLVKRLETDERSFAFDNPSLDDRGVGMMGMDRPTSPSQDHYNRSLDSYSRSNDPYSRPNDPYTRSNDPYNRSNDPYTRSNDPYSRQNDPYNRSNDPYSRQNDPYNRSNDPYSRPSEQYNRTGDPYSRSGDPYGRQSAEPYNRGATPVLRYPDSNRYHPKLSQF